MTRPVVVKIGGSLAADRMRLMAVLDHLASAPAPIIIVPGGGPFADEVRQAQGPLGLSDRACHAMAILAMRQFGLAIADLDPRVAHCDTLEGLPVTARRGLPALHVPSSDSLSAPELPSSWATTSDAIAAWLAQRIAAAGVVFVKSCAVPPGQTLEAHAAAGRIDTITPGLIARSGMAWRMVGDGAYDSLPAVLDALAAIDGRGAP
ncbi:MAG: aspartate kinase [Hyphomicrobiaceae bacterium]|nr:aspartate kinase [Hyphomicrobiaceae bacterium]